jgi:peptidoglycan hydrolase CwlO-like protein
MLTLLLFTSCVSNNSRTELLTKTNNELKVKVDKQEIEFKELQTENKEIVKHLEQLSERIEKIKDFYE